MGSPPKTSRVTGKDITSDDDDYFEVGDVKTRDNVVMSPTRQGPGRPGGNMEEEEEDFEQAPKGPDGAADDGVDHNTPFVRYGHGGEEDEDDEDDMYESRDNHISGKGTPSTYTECQGQRGREARMLLDPKIASDIDSTYTNVDEMNSVKRGKKIVSEHSAGSSKGAEMIPSSDFITLEGGGGSSKVIKESSADKREKVFRPFEDYRNNNCSSSGYYDSDHGLLSTSECYRLWKKQMMKECINCIGNEDEKSA
ncbi:hypothetical protein KC19_VG043600 [Ceratodon purpureus]|uniref:Uncharacterized protein n=1 Tax=Ceratodon purpureus TaxID=3225 RepID=A0A8T0HLV9_CERPU|nr:hypothetical protein KC19_VG043600 [Ceratodon purpureus]